MRTSAYVSQGEGKPRDEQPVEDSIPASFRGGFDWFAKNGMLRD